MTKKKKRAPTHLKTSFTPQSFRRVVYAHYRKAGRAHLPWRQTRNPYAILVSELMLQQTGVERVIPKYTAFLRKFPTVESLADATLPAVLQMWQGLGYNRRAQSLRALAQKVVTEYGGKIPSDEKSLLSLPGIGPYTASAIRAFAFNTPSATIETNIRTVYTHVFFPGKKKISDATLLPLIEKTLDRKNPREWYAALMDYGSHLKGSGVRINARSSHYVRQKKFEGSRRQLRGLTMRFLLEKPLSLASLVAKSGWKKSEVQEEMERLVKEGMVIKKGRKFSIGK